MEIKEEEKGIPDEVLATAEVLDSAPETEVEEVAEGYAIPDIYAPLEDVAVAKSFDKFLTELRKIKDLSVRHRPHEKWPSLIPEINGKSVCYCYPDKKGVRIETAHVEEVEGKKKTFRHTWSYQLKADGVYKSKEKVQMKVVIAEVKAFAKARGWT